VKRAPLMTSLVVVAILLLTAVLVVGGGSGSSEAEVSTGPGSTTTTSSVRVTEEQWDQAVNLQVWNQTVWNQTIWNRVVAENEAKAKAEAEEAARRAAAAQAAREEAAKEAAVQTTAPAPVARQAPAPAASTGSHGGVCNGIDLPPCYVVQRESGFNPAAENPVSTASGLYQFVDGTWAGFGGYSHAAYAPVSVQVAKARQVWAMGRGCGHWVACG
jgi:hypothetical protein